MEIKPNNIYCGDSYELIKNIPDKSIDLVYIDIPYLIGKGGGGGGELAHRIHKEQAELGNKASYKALEKKRDELRAIMDNAIYLKEVGNGLYKIYQIDGKVLGQLCEDNLKHIETVIELINYMLKGEVFKK